MKYIIYIALIWAVYQVYKHIVRPPENSGCKNCPKK